MKDVAIVFAGDKFTDQHVVQKRIQLDKYCSIPTRLSVLTDDPARIMGLGLRDTRAVLLPTWNLSGHRKLWWYKCFMFAGLQHIEWYDDVLYLDLDTILVNDIAKFWDCNPYVSHHKGHAMFATKKITPGGHWINICKIVSEKSNSNDLESIRTYALVSIALFDSFISCWDEKWKTIVVRPETLINEYIDEDWLPLLQTPPFPEYTSGHSVISRASAVILTKIFGDEFSFDDTSEIEFGLPMRSFDSFIHASDEAAISRLYGGIHYEMAISNGVTQGQEIGDFISNKLMTKKN